jgi:hypothetical protein
MNIFEDYDTGPFSNAFPLTNMADAFKHKPLPPHSSHPDFGHLTLLVIQAVMEVVFLALPGYILAEQGLFDVNAQKFAANLNVQLFTPCLSTLRFILLQITLTSNSLLQTLLKAPTRRSRRSHPHSLHFHNPDTRLVWMC